VRALSRGAGQRGSRQDRSEGAKNPLEGVGRGAGTRELRGTGTPRRAAGQRRAGAAGRCWGGRSRAGGGGEQHPGDGSRPAAPPLRGPAARALLQPPSPPCRARLAAPWPVPAALGRGVKLSWWERRIFCSNTQRWAAGAIPPPEPGLLLPLRSAPAMPSGRGRRGTRDSARA